MSKITKVSLNLLKCYAEKTVDFFSGHGVVITVIIVRSMCNYLPGFFNSSTKKFKPSLKNRNMITKYRARDLLIN